MSERNTHQWDGEYEFGSPWGDDPEERADSDNDDFDDMDNETDVRPCPNCGSEVYEEADVCPICGEFILDEPAKPAGQSEWRKLIIVLLIIGVLLAAGLGALW